MNFPRFWARGASGDFLAWRWSFQSLAEAQALANDAARQLAERFRSGARPDRHGGYYPNRPFREQVLREIPNGSGGLAAVITRNSYGCLVLNTAQAMFVDIDLPPAEKSAGSGFMKRLFGGKPAESSPQDEALARVERWTRDHPQWGWRAYRTHSGLRLLATQGPVPADSPATAQTFEALGADPLYRRLCQTQNCFRARLTPKPWRCGFHRKPERWPFLEPGQEARFAQWESDYLGRASNFATCDFLRQIGNAALHPDLQAIVELHDGPTRAQSKMPLA